MAKYDYRCGFCGHEAEEEHPMGEFLSSCPICSREDYSPVFSAPLLLKRKTKEEREEVRRLASRDAKKKFADEITKRDLRETLEEISDARDIVYRDEMEDVSLEIIE